MVMDGAANFATISHSLGVSTGSDAANPKYRGILDVFMVIVKCSPFDPCFTVYSSRTAAVAIVLEAHLQIC